MEKEKAKQSWDNCRYKTIEDYGCSNPKMIKLEEESKKYGDLSYILQKPLEGEENGKIFFYPDDRFYTFPVKFKNILIDMLFAIGLEDLGIKIKEREIKIPRKDEQGIVSRALAGCIHCKFHEYTLV